VWLSLRLDRMNREDVLTSQLEFVMLPYAGSLRADDSDNVKVTSLIASSETSAMVDAMSAQFGSEGVRRGFKSGLTRLNLALRLNGTFKTAYPDGKPAASPSDPADEKKDEPAASPGDALKESARPTTIILVADADMLYNRFCVQDVNFFGFQAFQPMNDNLAFFANAVEQLSGNIALASVRTRGKTDRSFDVVMDLQRQAEEKYLREEMRLQETLDDAQRRLNELQSKKDEKQRLFVSPQQQREIENVRGQVLKFKQELKLVRRKLREDIEQLGARVKALNIVLMPALVCVAGVGFGVYRRRRTAN
jgi:ABC-type uncharacterized transport system involved in gliding motility auxiliary subunit